MRRKLSSLADLAPDPKNANKGTTRGRQMVADSLSRYGAGGSILTQCFGMELNPGFLAVTIERLSDMGLKPKLVKHGKEASAQEQKSHSSKQHGNQDKADAPGSRKEVHVEAGSKRQSGRPAEEAHA